LVLGAHEHPPAGRIDVGHPPARHLPDNDHGHGLRPREHQRLAHVDQPYGIDHARRQRHAPSSSAAPTPPAAAAAATATAAPASTSSAATTSSASATPSAISAAATGVVDHDQQGRAQGRSAAGRRPG